jgi:hypothetical protein
MNHPPIRFRLGLVPLYGRNAALNCITIHGKLRDNISPFFAHTYIYATADTSMMKTALEKINHGQAQQASKAVPVWQDNEEMILKLCGLK